MSNFLRNHQNDFHSGRTSLQSHQQWRSVPPSPHPRQHLLSPEFLILAILTGVRWNLRFVLICISLMIKDTEHFIRHFSAIPYSSGENSLFSSEPHFKWGYLIFWSPPSWVLYIYIRYSYPIWFRIGKDPFPICWWPIFLIDGDFCFTKSLQFYEVLFVDFQSYSTSHCCSIQDFFPCAHIFDAFSPLSPL